MTATTPHPERILKSVGVEEVRSQFPSQQRMHSGHPVAYLDGPGGTQVPSYVVDRMADYLLHHNANTHWKYPTSAETDKLILGARRTLAEFVNGSADEIAFGANMTTITFHVARALGMNWGPKDEIVVTELDHHANVAPWQRLEHERGVKVVMARMRTEDGTLDLEDLENKITARTRLVACVAASNALGTIVDIPRVAAMAHAKKAFMYVDAVHFAPHEPVDVRAMDADFLACSAYKFYGPHIGVVWGKRELLEQLDIPRLAPSPNESPERLETGTQNHEGIVGAGAAVDWIASLVRGEGNVALSRDEFPLRAALQVAMQGLHVRGALLFERLWNGLGAIKRVRRFGLPPDQRRTPTLSFRVDGVSSDDVAVALASRGLFVSHGDFYAATIVERLGNWPDGVVRVGCSAYTTKEEIDRVIEAVGSLARKA